MSKCVDEDLEGTGLKCKPLHEIDEYIKEIVVNGFTITEKISFDKFGQKPVESFIKKQFTKFLEPNR
jgi:hypothetical protein